MTRRFVPGEGIDHLSRDPVCGELLILGKSVIRHTQEETLTVMRLGLPANLERVLSSTNLIENLFSRVREIGRRVKRWQSGTMVLRWTAAGVLEAQRGFRKLAGYRALPALVAALRAHDAQLDRTEGKLDTARNAA
jgi:putative transposase